MRSHKPIIIADCTLAHQGLPSAVPNFQTLHNCLISFPTQDIQKDTQQEDQLLMGKSKELVAHCLGLLRAP